MPSLRPRRLLLAAVMTTALAVVPIASPAKGPGTAPGAEKASPNALQPGPPAASGIGRKAH